MQQGFKDIAQRMVNAEDNLADSLMAIAGITKPEAIKVIAVFRKAKAIKLDAVGGRYLIKHGAFMEADAIRRALTVTL